jgi:hypothetical protein
MGRETQTVGFSKDARQINCTDEEARILLRKDLPRSGGPKPSGPVRALLGFLILNRGPRSSSERSGTGSSGS